MHRVRRAALWTVLLGALEVAVVVLPIRNNAEDVLVHAVGTTLVATLAWLAIKVTYVVDDLILSRHPLDIADNLRARQLKTQVELFRRVVGVLSCVVALSFENWTRSSAAKLGWACIEVDYSAPVDAIREKFNEICAQSPDWDGLTMQLRALMSSTDSGRPWNLQCEVREKLIAFLQQEYPWALPRLRAEPAPPGPRSGDGDATPRAGTAVPNRADAGRQGRVAPVPGPAPGRP